MRAAILALTLCLAGVLADDYARKQITPPIIPGFADTMPVTYYVRNNSDFKKDWPIFYGIAGRVPVTDIKNQYKLFESIIPSFDSAIVAFAEQRFFGTSKHPSGITNFASLKGLTLDNVIDDHVRIIQDLSVTYNSKNFLVFGGGHGGVIAGYVARRFQQADLKNKFNVLGWSSSPPIKYLRRDVDASIPVTEVGTQFNSIITKVPGDCTDPTVIAKFSTLFGGIRSLNTHATGNLGNLQLDPTPTVRADLTNSVEDDQKELVLYVRNKLLSLAFDLPYIANGNLDNSRKLSRVCTVVKDLNSAADLTVDRLNLILRALNNLESTDITQKFKWKVSDDGNRQINQELAPAAYQDCTEYQIPYCPPQTPNALSGSVNDGRPCTSEDEFKTVIRDECRLYFRGLGPFSDYNGFDPAAAANRLNSTKYPVVLNDHVVTTVNTKSIFGGNADTNFKDDHGDNFSYYWSIGLSDNIEFQPSRSCDSNKLKNVRYQILRAFGCIGNFITDDKGGKDFCNKGKQFSSGPNDDNLEFPQTCPLSTYSDDINFPFKQTPAVKFQDPNVVTKPTPNPSTSTLPTTLSTSTKGGAGFIPSVMVVMASAVFVWFTTL